MNLLVTGGCGFIGTNFIRLLLGMDKDVRAVNLDKLTYAGNPVNLRDIEATLPDRYVFVHGDIADPVTVDRVLEEYAVDSVVNFAAESHVDRSIDDPAPFVETNIRGAQVLLEAARRRGVGRFVHVSTDEVYGSLGPEGLFSESTPLAPNSPYSASKAAADMMVRAYWKTYGLPAVITRCSNNYGPYQFPEKLIPLMFSLALEGRPLPVYGDGLNVRDWIHVEDHCRGVCLALMKGKPGAVYNFGGDAERTNLEVVREILRVTGRPESLISFVEDRPGHDRRYAMDFSLAADELGFTPAHTFAQGLADTLAWYEANGEWLDSVRSGAYRQFMNQWYGDRL